MWSEEAELFNVNFANACPIYCDRIAYAAVIGHARPQLIDSHA